MAVEVLTSGANTPTNIGSVHVLATVSGSAYVLQLAIDLANMANGSTPDLLEVSIIGKARSGDTARLIKKWSIIGAQTELLWLSPPFISPHYFSAEIKQTQGTGRVYPWGIYKT